MAEEELPGKEIVVEEPVEVVEEETEVLEVEEGPKKEEASKKAESKKAEEPKKEERAKPKEEEKAPEKAEKPKKEKSEEKVDEPEGEAEEPKKAEAEEEIEYIVRIAGKDLDGKRPMPQALLKVKGLSSNLAKAISRQASEELKISYSTKLGLLNEKQVEALEDIVLHPSKHGIPIWMLNRRGDYETGEDKHLSGHELDFARKGDIDREKKSRSYRGDRHQKGLRVRGQRTRTTGRKGTTVGVHRRKNVKGSGK